MYGSKMKTPEVELVRKSARETDLRNNNIEEISMSISSRTDIFLSLFNTLWERIRPLCQIGFGPVQFFPR